MLLILDCLPCLSKDWCFEVGEARLCGLLRVASLLLCICSLTIEYLSPTWGSAAGCHFQLLERQVYSLGKLCSNQIFLSLSQRRYIAALCMLYKVNSNSNHCLVSELPSASVRVRHTRAAAAGNPLEFA